jgi:hypothetical protein
MIIIAPRPDGELVLTRLIAAPRTNRSRSASRALSQRRARGLITACYARALLGKFVRKQ